MGDSIATNLFMVGYAYQRGLLPLSEAAIVKAIELNGAAVESNKRSFRWGRLAAVEPEKVAALAVPRALPDSQRLSASLDEIIERRVQLPDRLPGRRLRQALRRPGRAVRARQRPRRCPGITALTEAVARYYFKLLAIKDEYEVARLYAESDFSAARRRAVRGRLQADLPPRAAALQQARSGDRRAAKIDLRPVDDEGVRRAREAAPVSRQRAGRLRPVRRAPARARADRRLRGDARTRSSTRLTPANHGTAVELARSRSTSAATATSGRAPAGRQGARGRPARRVPVARAGAGAGSGSRRGLTPSSLRCLRGGNGR